MSVFDLTDSSAIEERARTNGITQDQVQPGFFEGSGYGIGMGIARGGAKLVRAGALVGAAEVVGVEKILGADSKASARVFDFIEEKIDPVVDYFTPSAQEVGTLGRVMGSLSEIVAPLAVARGNPMLLMGSVGLNTTYDLSKQGVKPTTAVGVGMIDSAAIGLGFRIPFLGSTFAKKAATGAAGSLALGIGATAADQAVLEAGGYDEIAKQYNPLDIEARTVDLLTGIAFGGIAQLQTRGARAQAKADAELLTVNDSITRSDRDAALSGLNALHYQFETAPGRPLDEAASIAHQKALETAIRQVQEGRPVHVGESRVTEARFGDFARETPSVRDPELRALFDELGIRERPPKEPAVRPAEDAIVDTERALTESPVVPDGTAERPVNPAETDVPRQADFAPDETFSARKIIELHQVTDRAKVDSIADSMESAGWNDRPLLVWDSGDGIYALTGSHRLAAAKKSGTDVPVILVDGERFASKLEEDGLSYDQVIGTDDAAVAKFLREAGDNHSADLMDAEVRANDGEAVDPVKPPARPDEAKNDPDDMDVIAAERSVEVDDIAIETGEVDADGKYKSTSARESLAAARQGVATAKREASAFEAAVACALSFGDA